MNPSLYFLHGLTPIHVGVGEGLGAINLPIARERMSGHPYVPGSSVKGVLREAGELRSGRDHADVLTAFGPPTERAADARGGVVFSDASLLCLPVRSLLGTFAWVTAPVALERLRRDAVEARLEVPGIADLLTAPEAVRVPEESALLAPGGSLYLEDLLLSEVQGADADAGRCATWLGQQFWPEGGGADAALVARARSFFLRRFMVVPDNLFNFLSRVAVEVRSRVKIDDETGTAAQSGPWQEEALPAETLLYGLLVPRATRLFPIKRDNGRPQPRAEGERGEERSAAQSLAALRALISERTTLRFGGKSSVGMGRARFVMVRA